MNTSSGGRTPVVTLRDAAFGYAGRAVVSGVTLEIASGDVVAVLGPNGSGKSTLMRGVLGLTDHVGGEVELFGIPAAAFRDRTRIGYVPQRHTLSASVRATVEEIVEVGRLAHRPWYRRSTDADRAAVVAALDEVGLGERADADVSTLSGGQHRRVLIARALAAQPDILVMDEPTAGVDAASQEVLAEVLERLAGSGVTMVIVTHEIEALSHLITRVVEVSGGRAGFDGTPAEYAERLAHRVATPMRTLGADGGHHEHEHRRRRPELARGPFDDARIRLDGEHRG